MSTGHLRSDPRRGWTGRFDIPAATAAVTAVAYLGFLVVQLAAWDWDPSGFIHAGSRLTDADRVQPGIRVGSGFGYDGQFYYRLALTPFTSTAIDHGVTLDSPAYRQQRILYPLLVWAVTGGRPVFVPAALIAVNYVGLCLLGWSAGAYARQRGRHALWGLAFAFYPGLLLSFANDLTEIWAAALLVTSLVLLEKSRRWPAAVVLALAVLARETVLLTAMAALGATVVRRRQGRPLADGPWPCAVLPLTVAAVWQMVLWRIWGELPGRAGSITLGWPFAGLLTLAASSVRLVTDYQLLVIVELYFLGTVALTALASWRSADGPLYPLAWLLCTSLAALLGPGVWSEDGGFLRALTEFYIFSIALVTPAPARLRAILGMFTGSLWLLVARSLVLTALRG